jgi:hypothetical protein
MSHALTAHGRGVKASRAYLKQRVSGLLGPLDCGAAALASRRWREGGTHARAGITSAERCAHEPGGVLVAGELLPRPPRLALAAGGFDGPPWQAPRRGPGRARC